MDASQTTTHESASRFDVSIPTALDHLKEIGKIKKLGKRVPHERNQHQMIDCRETCCSLLPWLRSKPFSHCNVMCDEKWTLFNSSKHSAQCLGTLPKHNPTKEDWNQTLHQLTVTFSGHSTTFCLEKTSNLKKMQNQSITSTPIRHWYFISSIPKE